MLISVLFAYQHINFIDNVPLYRSSFFIFPLFALALLLFAIVVIQPFIAIVALLRKNWIAAAVATLFWVLAFAALGLTFYIDAPTLIFAT